MQTKLCNTGQKGSAECMERVKDCQVGTGADYKGKCDGGIDIDGRWKQCVAWPVDDERVTNVYPDIAGYREWTGQLEHFTYWHIKAHNYCRNPNNKRYKQILFYNKVHQCLKNPPLRFCFSFFFLHIVCIIYISTYITSVI